MHSQVPLNSQISLYKLIYTVYRYVIYVYVKHTDDKFTKLYIAFLRKILGD